MMTKKRDFDVKFGKKVFTRCVSHKDKLIFKNEVEAFEVLRKMGNQPRNQNENLHIYKCPIKDHWHIGHDK